MTNENPTEREKLKDRLYAELARTNTESDEFKAAFRYIQELEDKDIDPEIAQIEKDTLMIKHQREVLELEKESEPQEKETFWTKNMNVLIPAAGTLAGIVVIVGAEIFGPAILNSKAFNRLPKP